MLNIKTIIKKAINKAINEYRYSDSSTPINSKEYTYSYRCVNPTSVDVGSHSSNDVLSQPSTFDKNGENFVTDDNIVLSDNKFTIYKIKNFGNDNIQSTLDFFGKGKNGEKNLRKEIDTLNGASTRNGKSLIYRTITSQSYKNKSENSGKMLYTFWEFSFDNGATWYILKPNGTQNMKPSKLIKK